MDTRWREDQERRARALAAALDEDGVDGVALSYVDNAGVTRVKAVPVARLPHAAALGRRHVAGVRRVLRRRQHHVGPARRRARLATCGCTRTSTGSSRLAAQPGWAWAPVDRFTQDGEEHPGCQRSFARQAAAEAADDGLDVKMGFEVEWVVGTDAGGEFRAGVQRSGVRHDPDGRAVGLLPRPADRARRGVGGGAAAAPGVRRGAVRALRRTARPGGAPRTRCCSCGRRCGRCPAGTAWRRRSPRPSWPARSATASTCTCRCATAGSTCSTAATGGTG